MIIYFKDYSNNDEFEFEMKGHRKNVFVEINADFFQLHFIEFRRMQEDLETLSKNEGYYIPKRNVIITNSVKKEDIISLCIKLGEYTISCMEPCLQEGDKIFLRLSDPQKKAYLEGGWQIFFERKALKKMFSDEFEN